MQCTILVDLVSNNGSRMAIMLQYNWHLLRYRDLRFLHDVECIFLICVSRLLNGEIVNNPINQNLWTCGGVVVVGGAMIFI